MVNLKLVPTWVWIAAPALVLAWVMVQQSMQASYYRGIAEDAEYRIEVQEIVLDSVVLRSDSLSVVLQEADSAIEAERLANEREVARLARRHEEERQRSEMLSESLRASLDSVQAIKLDDIIRSYEIQITTLDSMLVVERETKLAEALRADQASELILSLREVQGELGIKTFMLEAQVSALKQAMKPSLGLRLKADWWLAVVGLAGGYVLWGTK
mgnify:FL=1